MSFHPTDPQWNAIDAVVDATRPLEAYDRWLAAQPEASSDYLFSEARARFTPESGDMVCAPADLEVRPGRTGCVLRSTSLGGELEVSGVGAELAARLLRELDGERTLGELWPRTPASARGLSLILEAGLGRVLFVPQAVAALEARISGAELVRFVGTPYELVRNYWQNMAEVRQVAARSWPSVGSTEAFTRWLRRLHVIALIGLDQAHFYRPASRISARGVAPGALFETTVESERRADTTLILSGPRVGLALIGGPLYHALVCAEDPQALARERQFTDSNGLAWGSVVYGRAPHESESAAWFLPPRPLDARHFDALFAFYRDAASAAEREDRPALIEQLSRFHRAFVRLHPFRCANQSLCMNLVNLLLGRAFGAGIPHHLLDHFALRLSAPAYARLFARAVERGVVSGAAAARWAELRRRKQSAYAFIERVKGARELGEAWALAEQNRDSARAALIDPDALSAPRSNLQE